MAWRLTVFVNHMLASKVLKMTGSLLRNYLNLRVAKLKAVFLLCTGQHMWIFICIVLWWMLHIICVAHSAGYQNILYSWCRYESQIWIVPLLLGAAWSFREAVIPMKGLPSEKMYTYFVCNTANHLFQVLSSTVSIQAMQKLTGGQEAMKIRPRGKLPSKYFKWMNK